MTKASLKKLQIIKKNKLDKKTLSWMVENIFMTRAVDDTEIKMKLHSQSFFQIATAGHEGVQTAAALILKSSYDQFICYYRQKAICLGLGVTPYEMFCQANGNTGDSASMGRQMPGNAGNVKLNIITRSSCTGTQFLQACGVSEAGLILSKIKGAKDPFKKDEITYVSCGDGTTSQGEFWEGLTTAVIRKLPVLFMVEDNGFAISTPTSEQTPEGSISKTLKNFPGLLVLETDGNCPLLSYETLKVAEAHLRARKGPVLVHAHVHRVYSHSLSELEKVKKEDVLVSFPEFLVKEKILTKNEVEKIREKTKKKAVEDLERCLKTPWPKASTSMDYLYSDEVSITDSSIFDEKENSEGENVSMAQALNMTLKHEIERNPKLMIFGEDVADNTNLKLHKAQKLKGKGGVFKVTHGIQSVARDYQVFNSPLAEANIVGRAIGMAMRGLRPVVEIQFLDYIWTAFMQIKNEMATTRYRSGGTYKNPMVIRVASGGYTQGGALYHSQSAEAIMAHIPGIYIAYPTTTKDAVGLLRTAMRCDDPVIFLEHKQLYYQGYNRTPYPGDEYMIPFGKARIAKAGSDMTIICWGALVQKSIEASKKFADHSIEIIDLRTINPLDMETIKKSVEKTHRVLIAHEAGLTAGFGAEIAARISQECFTSLDAPVIRLAAKDCHIPYNPDLEADILPQIEDVVEKIQELLAF
jgi:2-oxoisovalerate dehydrogenase E1 component